MECKRPSVPKLGHCPPARSITVAMCDLDLWRRPILSLKASAAVVRPAEETDSIARFGGPFVDYTANVRCWIPRRTPYSPEVDRTEPGRDRLNE